MLWKLKQTCFKLHEHAGSALKQWITFLKWRQSLLCIWKHFSLANEIVSLDAILHRCLGQTGQQQVQIGDLCQFLYDAVWDI